MIDRLRSSAEWRFLGTFWEADRRLTLAWWTLVAARGILPAIFTLAMGALVGAVEGGRPLGPPLLAAALVFIAMNALAPLHDAAGGDLGAKVGAWLHDRIMRACVTPEGIAHLERPDLAEELSVAREFDRGITAPPLSAAVPEVASGFATVAAGIAQACILFAYRWWAPIVVGGAWAATHVLLRESAHWKIWEDEGVVSEQRHVEYAYRLATDSPAAKEIRMFGLAGWVVDRFMSRKLRFVDLLYRQRRLHQRPLGWSLVAVVGANALVFWSLARDASAGVLDLRSLVVFAGAAVGTSALAFGDWDWWFRGSAAPIPRVLDLAERMGAAGTLTTGQRAAGDLPREAVVFDGVRFAYPTTGVKVLEGFDLTIPAGSSLAIVGPNGAGKTTITKLLCRLYDPQDGAVLVDGIDVRELDLASWRRRVAAVFQDFVRYELPLRANVAPNGAPDEDIEGALEAAGAADLASLDTILSRAYADGTDLSGGQWQRVALARALCAVRLGAGVVILDEPTAQLDVRGEAEIFDRILEATRGLTTILVSHRFSTVRHADRICVLEHGGVVEDGTHEELMAHGGRYKTMFDLQASRFTEGTDVLVD